MTVTATAIGVALAIPVGLGAARNLAPLPVYLFCRGLIALSRTFQEVIIAILFVKMFGFGPLAGMVTLVVGPIVGLGLSTLLGLAGPARQAAILMASMPAAVITTVLALEFDLEPSFATSAVFISTMLSPFSLVLVIAYLQRFY